MSAVDLRDGLTRGEFFPQDEVIPHNTLILEAILSPVLSLTGEVRLVLRTPLTDEGQFFDELIFFLTQKAAGRFIQGIDDLRNESNMLRGISSASLIGGHAASLPRQSSSQQLPSLPCSMPLLSVPHSHLLSPPVQQKAQAKSQPLHPVVSQQQLQMQQLQHYHQQLLLQSPSNSNIGSSSSTCSRSSVFSGTTSSSDKSSSSSSLLQQQHSLQQQQRPRECSSTPLQASSSTLFSSAALVPLPSTTQTTLFAPTIVKTELEDNEAIVRFLAQLRKNGMDMLFPRECQDTVRTTNFCTSQ